MTRSNHQVHVAWGIELSQHTLDLVRLEQTELAAARAECRQQFDIGDFWNTGTFDAKLIGALAQIPANQPIGICFPDRAMMCRGFSLPRTSDGATEKMVKAQAEAMFSAGDDRLSWSWQKITDPLNAAMDWVLLCAVRRTLLDELKRAFPASASLRVVLPRAAAIAGSHPTSAAFSSTQFQIELADESATFSLLVDGRLWRCCVLDRDSDKPDASESWIREARQSYLSMMQDLPRDRRPTQAVLRAANIEQFTALAESLSAALGVHFVTETFDGDEQRFCGAMAAARLALNGIAHAATNGAVNASANGDAASHFINFVAPPRSAQTVGLPRRRLGAMAAACVAGILLLYGVDCLRDRWLTRQFEKLRDVESASGGIERRLAVGRYLEKNVSPALPGLDTILAAAPPSLNLTSFGVTAAGQFHLAGMLGSASELDDFLRKLQASKTLKNVQLRSARVAQRQWQVELSAEATPMAGLILGSSKAPVAAPGAPATQPVKRGGA